MTDKEIEKKINQLSSLKSCENLTEDQLRKKAIASLQKKESEYQFEGLGYPDKASKKAAEDKFKEICSQYNVSDLKDLQLLEQRIYLNYLCDLYKAKNEAKLKIAQKTDKISPFEVIDPREDKWYQDTLSKIMDIDDRLGIGKKEDKEGFDAWKEFVDRARQEAEDNIADHIVPCPNCGDWIHLIYEVKDYKAFPYAMLRGTWLYNEPLMKLIDDKILTMDQVAAIWYQPTIDYVKIIFEEIYLKDKDARNRKVS